MDPDSRGSEVPVTTRMERKPRFRTQRGEREAEGIHLSPENGTPLPEIGLVIGRTDVLWERRNRESPSG